MPVAGRRQLWRSICVSARRIAARRWRVLRVLRSPGAFLPDSQLGWNCDDDPAGAAVGLASLFLCVGIWWLLLRCDGSACREVRGPGFIVAIPLNIWMPKLFWEEMSTFVFAWRLPGFSSPAFYSLMRFCNGSFNIVAGFFWNFVSRV